MSPLSTLDPTPPVQKIDTLLNDKNFVPMYLQRRIQFKESTYKNESYDLRQPHPTISQYQLLQNPSSDLKSSSTFPFTPSSSPINLPLPIPSKILFSKSIDSVLSNNSSHVVSTTPPSNFSVNEDKLLQSRCLFQKQRILDQLQWKYICPIGPGLINLGNTCFLNSVLQCLIYIPPLANYLLSQDHSTNCSQKTTCIFCEMEKHIRICLNNKGLNRQISMSSRVGRRDTYCPKGIVSNLKLIAKHFQFGHQEDAHEFLRFLIEAMQKNVLSSFSKKLDPKLKETTVIHQIFGGYFRSRITCSSCLCVSDTLDSFLDICLDIRHADSLDKAFKLFIAPEKLTRDNSYQCSTCKRSVDANKRVTIDEAPIVLTIQFKRFAYRGGGLDSKISKSIIFPERLNLDPFMTFSHTLDMDHMSNPSVPTTSYNLCGVLVHSGLSCHSGHYFCFVKSPNDIWYSMNDASVRPVSIATVLSQPAYLLFYVLDNSQRQASSLAINKENIYNTNQTIPSSKIFRTNSKTDIDVEETNPSSENYNISQINGPSRLSPRLLSKKSKIATPNQSLSKEGEANLLATPISSCPTSPSPSPLPPTFHIAASPISQNLSEKPSSILKRMISSSVTSDQPVKRTLQRSDAAAINPSSERESSSLHITSNRKSPWAESTLNMTTPSHCPSLSQKPPRSCRSRGLYGDVEVPSWTEQDTTNGIVTTAANSIPSSKKKPISEKISSNIDQSPDPYDKEYDTGKIKKIKKKKEKHLRSTLCNPFQKLINIKLKAQSLKQKLFK